MDEGARRNRGPKRPSGKNERSRARDMYERRPLKTPNLAPPNYVINPQLLTDSYVEKEVVFAGVISDIPVELDTTNRTDVLRVIDRGKREEKIPWIVGRDNDAIFCLNTHNIKLSKRDGKEELLLRIAIHEVAAICYIRDDTEHVLGIKFGDREIDADMCQLAVLYCDSRGCAEELCSLIGQCFQLVYTEATMQFLDRKLSEAAKSMSISSSTIKSGDNSNLSTPTASRLARVSIFSESRFDLDQPKGTISSSNNSRSLPRLPRRDSTPSESDISAGGSELLQDYMKKLHTKLNADELRRFAILLKAWHTATLTFGAFCESVLDLYGPDRKYLLAGMRPFIPARDSNEFETFLETIGAGGSGNWADSSTSSVLSRRYRRTLSGASSYSNNVMGMDEFDRMLSDISADIENLETSVDMNTNPESFLPKHT